MLLTGLAAVTLALSACGPVDSSGRDNVSAPAATSSSLQLKGVCPDKVVLQTDWTPQAEHGGQYQLLGPGSTVDAEQKRVTGPLVAAGQDTGVQIEIRSGGPAIGFQTVSSQMYLDPAITLGQVFTDAAVDLSATHPTVAVVAPLDRSPQVILWDPATHPDWQTIADIGRTNAKVLHIKAATYVDYLTGTGILRPDQVDGSYDGSPATFVASGGTIAQQGYATSEPYLYEKILPQWQKQVKFQLIHDTGYPVYPEALSIRAGDKGALAPCLRKLVPIIQRSEADYLRSPHATNSLIADLVEKYQTSSEYSEEQAAFSVDQQLKLAIAGNGPDTTLGNVDPGRIQRIIDLVSPISARAQKPVRAGLRPEDIATNEFIDPSVSLAG